MHFVLHSCFGYYSQREGERERVSYCIHASATILTERERERERDSLCPGLQSHNNGKSIALKPLISRGRTLCINLTVDFDELAYSFWLS